MADRAKKVSKNLQQAPQKSALSGKAEAKKHARHVNIVHRTTSESLRLETAAAGGAGGESSADGASGSSSGGKHPPAAGTSSVSMLNAAAAAAAARKPKTSSFQITSVVTKGGPRISSSSGGAADNGEDSADDLDESHAEDSSRVTDIDTETPSFSEDTFSKEDVFFTSSDAIGSAPVIPTSSQYGLAIVAPNMPGAQNLADVHVSVTDAGINLMTNSKKDVDLKDIHHRNERFKVVKIESTEPFRRGRWICMDYLDHSTLQPTIEEGEAGETVEGEEPAPVGAEEEAAASIGGGGDETASVATTAPSMPANESPGQTLQQPLANEINNSSNSNNNNGSSNSSSRNQTSHAQTMAHIPTPQTQATVGTTPPVVTQTTNQTPVPTASPVTVAATAAQSQPTQAQSQPAPYYAQFTETVHGATLPVALQQQQQQQQPVVAPPSSQQNTQALIAAGIASTNALPQQLSVNVDASPQQEMSSTFSPATGISQTQTMSQSSPSIASPNNSQTIEPPPPTSSSVVVQPLTTVPNGPIDVPVPEDTAAACGNQSTTLNTTTTTNPQTVAAAPITDAAPAQPSPTSEPATAAVTTSTTDHPVVTIPTAGDTITASMASLMSPSTIAIATAAIASGQAVSGLLPQSQQQLLQNIVAEDGTSNEDSESASGTSAVAIDNKIEQAMDLVKSHLMFAVREEVEVLKEKIAELMDRINQLEVENTILKANASQETLSQLTATVPPKVPPTNPTNGPIS